MTLLAEVMEDGRKIRGLFRSCWLSASLRKLWEKGSKVGKNAQ